MRGTLGHHDSWASRDSSFSSEAGEDDAVADLPFRRIVSNWSWITAGIDSLTDKTDNSEQSDKLLEDAEEQSGENDITTDESQ
jgi:hypothetical protein